MHDLLKHTKRVFGTIILSLIMVFSGTLANAELSVEDIIKSRKALFSKNYSTAKRVQSFSSNGDFDKAIDCLLYTSPSPRDGLLSRMPSSA